MAVPPPRPPSTEISIGLPSGTDRATCGLLGRWGPPGFRVHHWLYLPDRDTRVAATDSNAGRTLFRGNLPFPQVLWRESLFEVIQLVFPFKGGFVARYYVANHDAQERTVRLVIAVCPEGRKVDAVHRKGRTVMIGGRAVLHSLEEPGELAEPEPEDRSSHPVLMYDLVVQPGGSRFVHVTTADLGGRLPQELLQQASDVWQGLVDIPRIRVPDDAWTTGYFAAMAARTLGRPEGAQDLASFNAQLFRPEGTALRLLPAVPAAWLVDRFEIEGASTPFGSLDLRYDGDASGRAIEIDGACLPPGGFRLEVPPGMTASIDGRPAPVRNGELSLPAEARRVRLDRP